MGWPHKTLQRTAFGPWALRLTRLLYSLHTLMFLFFLTFCLPLLWGFGMKYSDTHVSPHSCINFRKYTVLRRPVDCHELRVVGEFPG